MTNGFASHPGLESGQRRALHGRIGQVLEEAGEGDAELLTEHYLLGERRGDAARQARLAVEQAEQSWAFDRAAAMVRLLLELEARTEEARLVLLERLAEALKHAGRGGEAAGVYEQAAELTQGPVRWRHRAEASQLYMWFGAYYRGRDLLFEVADELGMRLPRSPLPQILWGLMLRVATRLRGIRRRERSEAEVPAVVRERIDLLLFGGFGAIITDQFLAFHLMTRGVLAALSHGLPRQQVLALAAETFICQLEPGGRKQSEAAFADAEALAVRLGDSEGLSFACMYRGVSLVQLGHWAAAGQSFTRAVEMNEQHVRGSTALTAWGRMFLAGLAFSAGRIREGLELYSAVVVDARSRGDVGLEVHARIGIFFQPLLLAGEPERCERGIDECLALLGQPEGTFGLMQVYGLLSRVQVRLYQGRGREALDLLLSHRAEIRKSGALRSGSNVALYRQLLATACIAAADQAPPRERARLLRMATRAGRQLASWGDNSEFYAALIGVGVLAGTGKRAEALGLLERAEGATSVSQSGLQSGCLGCLRAHYFGGPEDMAAAYEALGALGMADPKRWLRTWVSLLGQR